MSKPANLIIEADGGSRGSPGPAGSGAVVINADTGEVILSAWDVGYILKSGPKSEE